MKSEPMTPDTLSVRELPRRIEGLPVVKAVFLGWLGNFRQSPGYFTYALTYGVTDVDKGEQYQGHIMWAEGLDKPWRRLVSTLELTRDEARAAFDEYDKLAEWPEGN